MIMKDWRRLALFCLRLVVPELVEFVRGRRIMTFLARRFGGKYDGWEMEIRSDDSLEMEDRSSEHLHNKNAHQPSTCQRSTLSTPYASAIPA